MRGILFSHLEIGDKFKFYPENHECEVIEKNSKEIRYCSNAPDSDDYTDRSINYNKYVFKTN